MPKQLKQTVSKGGALYTYDFTDKIGGLPARIPLNGTRDGDCPSTGANGLGFVNYGMSATGGARSKKYRHKHKYNSKLKKTKKNRANRNHKSKSKNHKRK